MKQAGAFIANTLTENGQISPNETEIYEYLFNYIAEALAYDFVVLFVGAITHRAAVAICYLFVTIPLRHFAGGFHARTRVSCTIYSYSVALFILFSSNWMSTVSKSFWGNIYIVCLIVILAYAPVDTPNKRLSAALRKKLFRQCVLWCIVITFAAIILYISDAKVWLTAITLSLTACAAGVFIGALANKRGDKNEHKGCDM